MDNSTMLYPVNESSTHFDSTKDERAMDNSTIMDYTNDERGIDNETLLERMHEEYMIKYIPVFVYFSLVLLFGTVGNCINFIYYRFKVNRIPQTELIAYLAFIDILNCLAFVPEFFNLAFVLTFKSEIGCKFSTFLLPFLPAISHFILWLICIERYIKMCKPKWRQFSLTSVKVVIGIIIVIALALSIPPWFWRGISTVTVFDNDNNPITVHYCSERGDNITGRMVYKAILGTFLVSLMLSFLILYSLIGHKRFVTSRSETETPSDDLEMDPSVISLTSNGSDAGPRAVIENERIAEKATNRIAKISKIEWKFTLMVFMMTSGMVVAIAPALVVTIMTRLSPVASGELSAGVQWMWRSYMMTHAINPYIIAYFNTEFRSFVKHTFCKFNCK